MNIKQAREQIKNAMTAYFTKDEYGQYLLPPEKQRPVFLMGPPGIGKTAVMEQVAQELGVALVSYSMTHHTRQSALGLPFIVHKQYEGMECDVSEYTMSEIIASVYDLMAETGVKEGILFLDEINCVSETLAPVMLQFLQYKIFGRHKVPDGWIVVTAGNPPEYNNSVREFDIVTWDRLKRIDVEPDYDVWREYALNRGVHPAVLTYLDIKKADFYKVESTVGGKKFVTARGWDDLSVMIGLYEQNHLKVDGLLIGQYVQEPRIARDFAVYYDLFNKYRSDYQVDKILAGNAGPEIIKRAKKAKFDERLALMGLLLDALNSELSAASETEALCMELLACLKRVKAAVTPAADMDKLLRAEINGLEAKLRAGQKSGSMKAEARQTLRAAIDRLGKMRIAAAGETDGVKAFAVVKGAYERELADMKRRVTAAGGKLSNAFRYAEAAFGDGQEMLILVTELTISQAASRFIARYGCKEYFAHNKELLFYERRQELIAEIRELDPDE